jgi:hypothetical protein
VLNRRPQIADVPGSRAGIRSRTGRLLAALGLVTISPEIADAARKSDRHDHSEGRTKDDAQDNPDDNAEKTQDEQKADRKNDAEASDEDGNTGDKSGKPGKHDRNEERSGSDESSDQNGSDGGKSRGDSPRRHADSDSTSRENSSADDDSHYHGGRHVRDFAQRADEAPDDSPQDDLPDVTTVTPANPNVLIDDVPDTSINDLVVQGNDNVLASVSTSGGFAFARSGDVVAVTGPDGASIMQTGDVTAGTSGTIPAEPSEDGGNNNADFLS